MALILPTLGRSERDAQPAGLQHVTCENSMGVVEPSQGRLAPASPDLRSEPRIVAELAAAILPPEPVIDWLAMADDYTAVRARIAAVVPGFEEFEQRLADDGLLVLPHAVRDHRRFETPGGRARFTVHPLTVPDPGAGRYLMMTIRSHDQFNTTVYSDNDRYRGIAGSRRVLFICPQDMAAAALVPGARVAITSHFRDQRRRLEDFVVVPYQIPPGCVATYYPETNPLIPVDHVAQLSNTPAYKSVVVSIDALAD
jgi:anaerobic selenocysteine-containing dehydrogenase